MTSTLSICRNFAGGVHILDEIPNQHSRNIEAVSALLTDLAVGTVRAGRIFGCARATILIGDFHQVCIALVFVIRHCKFMKLTVCPSFENMLIDSTRC
jgi:hypothetical protein